MNRNVTTLLIAALLAGSSASISYAQPVYRWVDKDGIVHYGDRIPPEYANRDRDILNSQAVAVGFERGALTEEQIAALERQQADDEAVREREQQRAQRDRMLLDTYLTVEDIENLRDQRLELLQSQITVTEQYLDGLEKRRASLEHQLERIQQTGADSDKSPQFASELIDEHSQTLASISLYEESLKRTRVEQQELREAFAADIQRFIELTGDTL